MREVVKFDDANCQIVNKSNKIIAVATKVGSLYYLEYNKLMKNQQLNVVEKKNNERCWHHCYGHFSKQEVKNWLIKGLYTVLIVTYLKRLVSLKHVLAESITEASSEHWGYMFKRIT